VSSYMTGLVESTELGALGVEPAGGAKNYRLVPPLQLGMRPERAVNGTMADESVTWY